MIIVERTVLPTIIIMKCPNALLDDFGTDRTAEILEWIVCFEDWCELSLEQDVHFLLPCYF